ncbi:MAG: RNA polymerase sigma factor [Deltaproteobacteria bacterium]|nr:RNA polymerase sigma factor [Deltaproteobacteria bacterium]
MGLETKPKVDAADAAMERYSNGDDAAFAELYDAIAPRLLGFLRRVSRDAIVAEDLMQQTFLQMHRARGSFISGARVKPWAFAIAKRLLIDDARRRQVELRLFSHLRGKGFAMTCQPAMPDAADQLHARRLEHCVQQRLDALPDNQRIAFRLVKEEGLSLKKTAELLGTSVTAVKLRTHRAYTAVRSVFRERPL